MSTIALTSFKIVGDESDTITNIESISFPFGIMPPKGRLTTLYGTRSSLDYLSVLRALVLQENKILFRISIKVDGGDNTDKKIKSNLLAHTFFLNLNRINVELENQILKQLKSSELFANEHSIQSAILSNPTEAFNLLWSLDEYKHLKLIAFETKSEHGKAVRYGILRDESVIESIEIRDYDKPIPKVTLA